MKGILEAPDNVKLKILEVSDPREIRACQLVCRFLHNLIVSSPQIQYILTLDTLGYTVPSVARPDLSPREKVEFLERHRRNWSQPGTCQPTEYLVHQHTAGTSYEFDGGVYARPNNDGKIEGLHFYQIPSPNLGLQFREWSIPRLGLSAVGFTIDTAQDLLVLVELVDPSRPWSNRYSIHLRTMSENSQHPNATLPCLTAAFTDSEGGIENRRPPPIALHIEVVGKVLAILFRPRYTTSGPWVIVWDWKRGVEVTRISTGTLSFLGSFKVTLLSQNKLLLPRCSESYYTHQDVPGDTYGSLDVYIFDPGATTSIPPRMVASFELPKLKRSYCQSELRIERDQRPKPPSTAADPRPKVYDLAGGGRHIAITILLQSIPDAPGSRFSQFGIFYVPISVFLDPGTSPQPPDDMSITNSDSNIARVSWDTWAHLTCWPEYDPGLRGRLYGQRAVMASKRFRGNEEEQAGRTHEMLLVDFNRRRVSWAKSGNEKEMSELRVMLGGTTLVDCESQDHFGQDGFCEAKAEYVSRGLRVQGSSELTIVQIIMDDEHVIVQKLELADESDISGKLSLLVYTF